MSAGTAGLWDVSMSTFLTGNLKLRSNYLFLDFAVVVVFGLAYDDVFDL
jgi:hypothetical protein